MNDNFFRAIFIHDLIEENGKTIKENNLELKHNIPVGTLVEVINIEKYKGVRLYVVFHARDCDGTPLYCLCANRTDIKQENGGFFNYGWINGLDEKSLKILENKLNEKTMST
jgi:hypothetical protein